MSPARSARSRRVEDLPEADDTALRREIEQLHGDLNALLWRGSLGAPEILVVPPPPNVHHPILFGARPPARYFVFPDLCRRAGWGDVKLSLLRAMIWQWQSEQGDPSPGGHHNAEWHAEAERIGLRASGRNGEIDGATRATLALLEARRPGHRLTPPDRPRTKSKMHKWICGCTPTPFAAWVARQGFAAVCSHCGKAFRPAEV